SILLLLLIGLPSIQSGPIQQPQPPQIVTEPPIDFKKFYKDHTYVVPVEVPYKVKLPGKNEIQLGLQDALGTLEDQKINVGIQPKPQDIESGRIKLGNLEGSYLWSKHEKNNNIILAIHHEQPFELDFHLKSLVGVPKSQPEPAPAPTPDDDPSKHPAPVAVPATSGVASGPGAGQQVIPPAGST
ncbi:hypothetical protein PMAYCL1PPCAC_28636, partial [Pristionchus mayeri]